MDDLTWAVSVPDMRKAARQLVSAIGREEGKRVRDVALHLHAQGHRLQACLVLEAAPAGLTALDARHIARLARGLSDWGVTDAFGCIVTGPCWRAGRITDATVARWARSSDRWLRRLALVSTVPLNIRSRGGEGDPKRTLSICAELADDRDDMVVKALSWALRELSKRDPDTVRAFLRAHAGRLAARVQREVTRKLDTGRK